MFKVGQKYPTPAPANGDRVFYESLLIQVPTRYTLNTGIVCILCNVCTVCIVCIVCVVCDV